MAKITKNKNRYFFVILLLAVLFFTTLIIISRQTTNLNTKPSATTFNIGNFTLSLNNNLITSDSYSNKEEISKITGPGCDHVSSLATLSLTKSEPIPQNDSFQGPLSLFYESWNINNLKFDTQTNQKSALEKIANLENLYNYSDPTILYDKVTSLTYNADDGIKFSTNDVPNADIWRGFNSCSGYLSIPFYIQTLKVPGYDLAYYIDLSEGNASLYGMPSRTLILKKNSDWLTIKEEQSYPPDVIQNNFVWPGCSNGVTNNILKCVINLWNSKYRNNTQTQNWINQTLSDIKYNQP